MNTDLQKRTLTMMGWEAVPYHDGVSLTHYWLDPNKQERSVPDITLDLLFEWVRKNEIFKNYTITFSTGLASGNPIVMLKPLDESTPFPWPHSSARTEKEALSEALLAMAKEGV